MTNDNQQYMKQLRFTLILIASMFLAVACTGNKSGKAGTDNDNNVMQYAKMLRMYDHDGYTLAEILSPQDSTKVTSRFILLPEGAEKPAANNATQVITVPLKSAIVYSSVHAAAMNELGQSGCIKGVADASYFKLPFVLNGIDNGTITDIGSSTSPSTEKIIDLNPQAIIVNQYEGADLKGIDRLGIPVIQMAENLENTPLGRAEWIKFIGALTGERAKADSIFAAVEKHYTDLRGQAAVSSNRPKVLTENMYQGVWYVPGGASYKARMIADAGGIYPWADDKSAGSLNLSFEQVLDRAQDADYWLLQVFGEELSRTALLKMDSRYASFQAVDKGGVYYCDTQATFIFEETPFHPDRLLEDYIAIFSGKTGSLHYFKPMTR